MNAHKPSETEHGGERYMRSALVFAALAHVPDRYRLCQLTAKGARKLHRPNDRTRDTVNDVLMLLAGAGTVGAVASAGQQISVERTSGSTLHPVLQASHFPDASHIAISRAVYMPEERNFSHV